MSEQCEDCVVCVKRASAQGGGDSLPCGIWPPKRDKEAVLTRGICELRASLVCVMRRPVGRRFCRERQRLVFSVGRKFSSAHTSLLNWRTLIASR